MGLPDELIQEIQQVTQPSVDTAEVLRAVHELVGGDPVLDYSVWVGPGHMQPDLSLDNYIISEAGTYNYSVVSDKFAAGGMVFHESLEHIHLVHVPSHPNSPYMLVIGRPNDKYGLLFGREQDREKLERIRRSLVEARNRSMKGQR